MPRFSRLLHAMAFLLTASCGRGAVIVWEDARPLGAELASGAALALSPEGTPALVPLPASDGATGGRPACAGSLVVADDGARGAFAAWWEERGDRSVVLMVARQARDGSRAWGESVVADARDRGTRGCDRPPPAIAADGARGHVHLAYFLEPPEGPGVWAGHSMEDGAFFHGPIVIVYGEQPVRTAVDVEGDLVVMAHEDPNSRRARVAVAISETSGHFIEHRLPASPSGVAATSPLVAVRGDRVAVAWSAAGGPEGAHAQVRTGQLSSRVRRTGLGRDE